MKWNKVIFGDGIKEMKKIEASSCDLIFTSPPDLTETNLKSDLEKYKKFQLSFCVEFNRITKPEGFIVISQTDRKINGEILSHHNLYHNYFTQLGWKLKDHKIVVRNPVESKNLYRLNYQNCLIFTKQGTIPRKGDFLKPILTYEWEKWPVSSLYAWPSSFVELMINSLTKEKDKVVDCFSCDAVCSISDNPY